jgi:outer membrane cobalamin receptor
MPPRFLPVKSTTSIALFHSWVMPACLVVMSLTYANAWGDLDSVNEDVEQLDNLVITGERDEAKVLQESAFAVYVVDLETDQNLTADMGEVLSRVPGVSIRRSGGLGSRERFSLNGLRDDQIRFFIDGVPLDMSPYTFGISSIPVNLIERVDIYHGVVPIKFGADALAGAVNFNTDEGVGANDQEINGAVSLQYGSFNTWRSTLNLNYSDQESGFFTRLTGFNDSSDNDYDVSVKLGNEFGTVEPDAESVSVKRFHDAYEAEGANLDIGFREQNWAELFQVSIYASEYFKEIQHGRSMRRVYGEPVVERQSQGINLRYLQQLSETVELEVVAGGSKIKTKFLDVNEYRYNWLGEEIVSTAGIPVAGEININSPCDCLSSVDSHFVRVNVAWGISQGHTLDFSLAPSWNNLSSQNQYDSGATVDTSEAEREMSSLVMATAYTMDLISDQLQNTLFIKRYSQDRQSDQFNAVTRTPEYYDTDISRIGWGNQARYRFNELLYGKISYEHATRLPSAAEVFGNSVVIIANPDLAEEDSHNFNLSLSLHGSKTDYGLWRAEANYFIRDVDNLIALRPYGTLSRYENVASTESKGMHASAAWVSPSDFVDIDINFTSFDFTNTSKTGPFAGESGSRMPNVPDLFFNMALGLNWMSVFADYDELDLRWSFKFVDKFGLFWDGVGKTETNPVVPAQESHSLSFIYTRDVLSYALTMSAEVQNFTDEELYDYYGVQRPGRAFYVKTIFEF